MSIPDYLWQKVEKEIEGVSLKQLSLHREKLSSLYRDKKIASTYMHSKMDHLSYLLFRFGATFAACNYVVSELKSLYSDDIKSILDIGSGPGTASLAILEHYFVNQITLIEKDLGLLDYAKKFLEHEPYKIIEEDFRTLSCLPKADAALFSYSIGEVESWQKLIDQAMDSVNVIIIVEAGTPKGFERIKEIREHILNNKWFMLAPCPHSFSCPINKGDWCHFATRVQRRKAQKEIKGAELGFEDEKFSYFIATKKPSILSYSRIIRAPITHTHDIKLSLCSAKGSLEDVKITKKNKERFKEIKKKGWSDRLDTFSFGE